MSRSPKIETLKWGQMEIAGIGSGKDFKLWPGGGRQWDWRETGTHHTPGIQVADIQELLDHRVEIVVLSRGMLLALHTCADTLEFLESAAITTHVKETRAAAELYNRLAKRGEPVGGLFHSTC